MSAPLIRLARMRTAVYSWRSYSTLSVENLVKNESLPGLFSAKGLNAAWFERAELYTQRLKRLTHDQLDGSLEKVIAQTSRSALKREIHIYAQLLHNLQFSISALRPNSRYESSMYRGSADLLSAPLEDPQIITNDPRAKNMNKLADMIDKSFGSMVEFKTLLLNSNMAINGDGFTWLVTENLSSDKASTILDPVGHEMMLYVVNTYNAGSPTNINSSGIMEDMENQLNKDLKKQRSEAALQEPENPAESTWSERVRDKQKKAAYNYSHNRTVSYTPLMAIDASPKSWLTDYGPFGKREYLNRIWESIDWSIVQARLPVQENI